MPEHILPLVERSGTSFCNRVFLYESEEPLRSTTGTKGRKFMARVKPLVNGRREQALKGRQD